MCRLGVLGLALLVAPLAQAQILSLAELNTEQIGALDRQRTVVLIPGGVLEEHGPYLPSFADGYMNAWWTQQLAEAVVARPGWTALVFPIVPVGQGGANEIGGLYSHAGTVGVRASTLRSLFMDWASELGDQGFRWVFVVHNHGGPLHNRALDDAGDFFRDTYGGRMVHLFGLMEVSGADPPAPADAQAENGQMDVHAGLSETSRLLFLRPDLVPPGYRTSRSLPANDFAGAAQTAGAPGWPGYLGAPRHATAAFGAAVMRARGDAAVRVALQVLDGQLDERTLTRYGDVMLRAAPGMLEGVVAHEQAREARQEAWLRAHRP